MNLLCEPCPFPTNNQTVFGRAGLNLGKNEMCRALCQAGYQSFVFRISEAIPLVQRGHNNIHGKQVQCFLAFCCLILFAVACCGRISSPILLRLCSELLAQALPICNELEEGLDFVLVNC